MSLGPLVQTQEIEEVIDFSTSFKIREISLVIRKATPSTSLFQFFSPFTANVWMCCLASLVVVTLTMWVLEYFHSSKNPAFLTRLNIILFSVLSKERTFSHKSQRIVLGGNSLCVKTADGYPSRINSRTDYSLFYNILQPYHHHKLYSQSCSFPDD